MELSRRVFSAATLSSMLMPRAFSQSGISATEVVLAPSNLGLRPPKPNHEPGTWRAPEAFRASGLLDSLQPLAIHPLQRPPYHFEAQPGTGVRNGLELRRFSERLSRTVADILGRNRFPIVLGGDCSILLGCLLGARQAGLCGLIHVDGHSDFVHPGNYAPGSVLHSAAGMDLALASGRGEPLLTAWKGPAGPLVSDQHIVQVGEREDAEPDYAYPDIRHTRITRIDIRRALAQGVGATAREALKPFETAQLTRVWLHVDVDVLDEKVMPAVDSPGSPGLDFTQLAELIRALRASTRIIGSDISVFDPELDPHGQYALRLSQCLTRAFAPL